MPPWAVTATAADSVHTTITNFAVHLYFFYFKVCVKDNTKPTRFYQFILILWQFGQKVHNNYSNCLHMKLFIVQNYWHPDITGVWQHPNEQEKECIGFGTSTSVQSNISTFLQILKYCSLLSSHRMNLNLTNKKRQLSKVEDC